MRQQALASPDDIDLTTLGATLKRAASRLIALTLVAGALTYLTLSMIAPRYIAHSELSIVAKSSLDPFTAPDPQGTSVDLSTRMDTQAVNTHVRAIQSPDIIEKVATELRLAGRPEFNPVLGPVDMFTGLLRSLGLASVQSGLNDTDRVLNEVSKRLVVYSRKTAAPSPSTSPQSIRSLPPSSPTASPRAIARSSQPRASKRLQPFRRSLLRVSQSCRTRSPRPTKQSPPSAPTRVCSAAAPRRHRSTSSSLAR